MSGIKILVFALTLFVITTLVAGCGSESETNVPGASLTASSVTSLVDSTAHVHSVSIPFIDLSATAATADFQYRSSETNGHSHVIALSPQQMIDINNGMLVEVTSSAPDAGVNHTHTWRIKGGELLYEKFCYNCHSNDKRGASPMNVSFNSAQTSAVKNPSGAPLSTSPAATPDPSYQGSTGGTLDGASLYATNCELCHNPLATSTKANRTFSQIKGAITNNSGGMSSLGALSDAQLQAIADALVK